jgi:hypothetical protein
MMEITSFRNGFKVWSLYSSGSATQPVLPSMESAKSIPQYISHLRRLD